METELKSTGKSDAPACVEKSQNSKLPPVEDKVARLSHKIAKSDQNEAVTVVL